MKPEWGQTLTDVVEQAIGVHLTWEGWTVSLAQFVQTRAEALGFRDPGTYVRILAEEGSAGPEFRRLTNVITTGETCFFRNLTALHSAVLHLREVAARGNRRARVWCAACATGDEPHSLAILCAERNIPVTVLGTDINDEFLEVARGGTYSGWALRNLPDTTRRKHFTQTDSHYLLAPELRKAVRFRRYNLVGNEPPPLADASTPWDLILVRNVFIYFKRSRVQQTVRRLAEVLTPEGFLLLGAGEGLYDLDVPLSPHQMHGTAAFRREPPATERKAPAPTADPAKAADTPIQPEPPTPDLPSIEELLDAGKLTQARERLEKALADNSNDVVLVLSLGNVLLRSHEFDDALHWYLTAQSLAPFLAEAHFLQGLTYRKLEDVSRAEQSFRRALFLDPSYWPASFLLARLLERRGHAVAARTELERTDSLLRERRARPLFQSLGVRELQIPPEEVAAACRRALHQRR